MLIMAKRSKQSYSDAGKLGAEKTKEIWKKRKEKEKIEYEQNPEYCEYCGKIKSFEQYKKHSRFCCRSCSASWTNKHRDKSISKKAGESIKKYRKEHIFVKTNDNKVFYVEATSENIEKYKKKKICKICGAVKGKCKHPDICNKRQVFKSLEKFGFDLSTIGSEKVYEEYFRIKKILTNIYCNRKISDNELKQNWNYTSGVANFHKLLHSLDIITLSIKDARKIDFELGRINIPTTPNQYKGIWYTSWNNKEVYLRSSYELDYAKELDKNHIDYDCECLRIKYLNTQDNEYHCAIPDFYLKDTNTIVEIKSSWTLDIQNMKDKFKAYKELGYNCKLILDHKEVNLYELKFE